MIRKQRVIKVIRIIAAKGGVSFTPEAEEVLWKMIDAAYKGGR